MRDLDVLAVARGERVELGPLDDVAANRRAMLAALAAADKPVYGVNTGMGRLAGVALDAEQQSAHQRNLLIGRAVGGPPWLPTEDVRALLAVKLHGLLAPTTAASPELVKFLVDRLNDGFTPAVPRSALGSAGEIIPLSHAFQTFVGVGTVLEDGVEKTAAEALKRRKAKPFPLGPKEGASLIQGSPLALTHAFLRCAEAAQAVELQTLAAAMAVDVLGAPRSIYHPALAGPDTVLAAVLDDIRSRTTDSASRSDLVQAPLSFRVAPQALAHAQRTLDDLVAARDLLLAAPTDSPSFLDGRFTSTAGYHAVTVGLRLDAVTAALTHLAEISVQRLHRLMDSQFTGLNAQLAVDPGPQAGLSPIHKRAAGELHEIRRLAAPATLGSLDTSAGQEDVQAHAWAAGEQLRAVIDHLLSITACELIGIAQAHHLRGLPGAPRLRAGYAWIAETVPPVLVDRPLGADIQRLRTKFADR